MRWAMTRVLPLPAPARTSTGPFVVVTASRCGGFSGARRLSAVTAGCGMGTNDNTTARGRAPHPALSPVGRGRRDLLPCIRSARLRLRLALLDGYGLGEVSRLVDVAAEADRHVVSQ